MNKLQQYKLKRGIGIGLIVFSAVLLVLFAAGVILFGVNDVTLRAAPAGEAHTVMDYGQPYEDLGCEARLCGSRFFRNGFPVRAKVTAEGEVNTDVLGTYEITYRVTWLRWETDAKRQVKVVDTKGPEITLVTNEDWLTVVGEPYAEEGFSAVDEYDGDLTERVTATEENGIVTYRVSDLSGNEAVVQRKIRYYDPVPPELKLTGDAVTMYAGDAYVEPGYSAWDNGDGDITQWVEIFSDLIPYLAGEYEVTYTVSDSYGNQTTVKRSVFVLPKERPETVLPQGRIIYLTFDDGPSAYTKELLEILKRNEVKATFFVCDTEHVLMLPEIVNQGHAIGIHSETHNYEDVYASVDAYFDDMLWMRKRIYETTGVETYLLRFPGGSSNTVSKFNPGIMTTLTRAVEDCGYTYFDWNVDSDDAGKATTADEVFDNVTKGIQWAMKEYGFALVLQHDTQHFSIDAVERIIEWGKENGYTFLPLQPNSPGMHHMLNN